MTLDSQSARRRGSSAPAMLIPGAGVTGRPLILSIFPGIDLLGRAFEEVWPEACLVRGPDLLWGGDVRTFHPPAGVFDGVIGGPPCQAFSRLRRIWTHKIPPADDLIPEFERVVAEVSPDWWLSENVVEAPMPAVAGYVIKSVAVRDVELGGLTTRHRRFCFGTRDGHHLLVEFLALYPSDPLPVVQSSSRTHPFRCEAGGKAKRGLPSRGSRLSVGEALRRQGFLPTLLDRAPLTAEGKRQAVGNGVPMAMGRAVAKAVRAAVEGRA